MKTLNYLAFAALAVLGRERMESMKRRKSLAWLILALVTGLLSLGTLIDARCAIINLRADHDRLPADRHRAAELVLCRRVRGLQFLLLAPDSSAAHKDIGRALIARCAIITPRAAALRPWRTLLS
jgi:hypothetical protein